MSSRKATVERNTKETQISVSVDLDGKGNARLQTGIAFFEHMLDQVARHGAIDLDITADGDLEIDDHHTVEDVGIVLGQAVSKALGDKVGLVRYGSFFLPMDETLARVAVDLSGRAYLEHRVPQGVEPIRDFSFQLVEEFLRGFAFNVGANVHTEILYGRDAHHMAEALFKGLARALDAATVIDPRVKGIPSTKDVL